MGAFSLRTSRRTLLKKDVGEAIIKAGTNIASLGMAGAILLADDVTFVHGIMATAFGLLAVVVGVIIRDWRKS